VIFAMNTFTQPQRKREASDVCFAVKWQIIREPRQQKFITPFIVDEGCATENVFSIVKLHNTTTHSLTFKK